MERGVRLFQEGAPIISYIMKEPTGVSIDFRAKYGGVFFNEKYEKKEEKKKNAWLFSFFFFFQFSFHFFALFLGWEGKKQSMRQSIRTENFFQRGHQYCSITVITCCIYTRVPPQFSVARCSIVCIALELFGIRALVLELPLVTLFGIARTTLLL